MTIANVEFGLARGAEVKEVEMVRIVDGLFIRRIRLFFNVVILV